MISLIGQCACLDSNLECVVDEGNTEHHAEVRALNFAFRHEGNHPAFGSGIGRYIHGERDWFGNAEQREITGDTSRACVKFFDLRRNEISWSESLDIE